MRLRLYRILLVLLPGCFGLLAAHGANALELGLGISLNQHIVQIQNSQDIKQKEAEFHHDWYTTPAFTLVKSPDYFADSRFGWLLELSAGNYRVDEQSDKDGKKHDYKTGLSGIFGHINPIVFYRLGDKYVSGPRGWSAMFGVGYGLSFLAVDGNFVPNLSAVDYEVPEKVEVDNGIGYFLLPAVFTKVNFDKWFLGWFNCFGGQGFEKGDYTYRLIFRTFSAGYVFEL